MSLNVTWFSLIVVRHMHTEGGNLDLAHKTKEIHKIKFQGRTDGRTDMLSNRSDKMD